MKNIKSDSQTAMNFVAINKNGSPGTEIDSEDIEMIQPINSVQIEEKTSKEEESKTIQLKKEEEMMVLT